MFKCSKHPRYKGIRKPRPSKDHPEGCERCWEIYYVNRDVNPSKQPGTVKKKNSRSDRAE